MGLTAVNKYAKQAEAARLLRRYRRMCSNKRAFETEEAAYQKGQKVYQCPYCDKFHRSGKFGRFVKQLRSRA